MLRSGSDSADSARASGDPDEHRVVVSPQVAADASQLDAFAGGLWHQAQSVFGAIVRARTKSGQPVRTVGLTSCYRREGVSTVAAVVGLASAFQRKVLMVDANVTHPSIHRRFRVQTTPGMLQAVVGQTSPKKCVQVSLLGVPVVTAGCDEGTSASFLRADLALTVLQGFTSEFDLVLVDLPPINDESSGLELATAMDGVVLVVESERVHWQAAQRTISRMQQSGCHLLGAVFNKRQDYTPEWLYRVL